MEARKLYGTVVGTYADVSCGGVLTRPRLPARRRRNRKRSSPPSSCSKTWPSSRPRSPARIQFQHILPHSGLEIVAPRFVLDRTSGKREPALLQPGIVLKDDPFNKGHLVQALLERVDAASVTGPAAVRRASPRP